MAASDVEPVEDHMEDPRMPRDTYSERTQKLMARMVELLAKIVEQQAAESRRNTEGIQPWTVVTEDPDPLARRRGLQELMERLRKEEHSQSELLGHIACAQLALLKDTQDVFGSLLSEVRALREGLAISVPTPGLASEPVDTTPS